MSTNSSGKITEGTLFPLSLIGGILTMVALGAWWMSALYSRVSMAETNIRSLQDSQGEVIHQLQTVNETLVEIRTVLKTSRRDTFSRDITGHGP